jgi:hypothetical protein
LSQYLNSGEWAWHGKILLGTLLVVEISRNYEDYEGGHIDNTDSIVIWC